MTPTPVIAVFDVGKTNKKLFLFDEEYRIIFERTARFNEIEDEDRFPCENLHSLEHSVLDALHEIGSLKQFDLKAVNFSAYGASLVYLDKEGKPLAPLYNYLKPYPHGLAEQLYERYGGEANFLLQTASPALGNLNSGLQLYRIKQQNPGLFAKIHVALHLPQYLSYLVTGKTCADMTSIGCHTALWDFSKNDYHEWVHAEGLTDKFPDICPTDDVIELKNMKAGVGLHDSSAALIPYLQCFSDPFVLLSTGTWSISLNPFNQTALTQSELENDCLSYFQYTGKPVKAARLFLGQLYDEGIREIATRFNSDPVKYRSLKFDAHLAEHDRYRNEDAEIAAYYRLMQRLVELQTRSTELVLRNAPVKKLFVDGGFGRNDIFMHLLACAFPHLEVYAASVPQSTALGAALAIHSQWNPQQIGAALVTLNRF
jgi:sugar (pentulose or hexulose) kinase